MARLLWRSLSQPLEVVPSHRLYHGAAPVVASPFAVRPEPVKPLAVVDAALSVAAWDALEVTWRAPWDDGGSAVDGYKVEWWAADENGNGTRGVQTLKLARGIDGGAFGLVSPAGIRFPAALPWNVTAAALEAALESLPDVGQVRGSAAAANALALMRACMCALAWDSCSFFVSTGRGVRRAGLFFCLLTRPNTTRCR
jgi:hypothetical protein